MARRDSTATAVSARALDAVSTVRSAASSSHPPTAPPVTLADVEHAFTAGVERRLDRKVSAAIEATLGADGALARALTDRVYAALYDRMVLEKERLG